MAAMAKLVFVLPREVGAFPCEATERAATLTAGIRFRFMAPPGALALRYNSARDVRSKVSRIIRSNFVHSLLITTCTRFTVSGCAICCSHFCCEFDTVENVTAWCGSKD